MSHQYTTLEFTSTFTETFASKDFTVQERKTLLKALRILDENEKHPSLRVHKLQGDREGSWSASATRSLRITYEKHTDGRKRLLTCSEHYDR